ncbi:MAG: hypothetical protein ACLGIY_10515 [Betaproteobacteria bacterium]
MKTVHPFALGKRSRYPAIFLVTVAGLATGILLIAPPAKQAEFFLPAVAAAAGFAYFLYSQHLQETRLFTELFRQFNAKYDSLNERLNEIAAGDAVSMLALADKQVLFDYFNLCAEEYLYYKTGFIDEEVWASWLRGMGACAKVEHIRSLWQAELEAGSYYGFTLDLLPSAG